MSAAIYALKIDDEIVYVGQSKQVENRIAAHLSAIANGRGIAGQYPEVFAGKTVAAAILEVLTFEAQPPYDPQSRSEAEFRAYYDWTYAIRNHYHEREYHYIALHQPKCNKRGREPVKARITIETLDRFSVRCPAAT